MIFFFTADGGMDGVPVELSESEQPARRVAAVKMTAAVHHDFIDFLQDTLIWFEECRNYL